MKCLNTPPPPKFQERHHYINAEYAFNPVEDYKERDKRKQQLALQKGITLVTVPCWWDGKPSRFFYIIVTFII